MVVRAVVFDLDGTLVDFNLDYREVRAEVLGFLSRQGLPRSIFSLKESIFKTLKKAEIYMKNHSRGEQDFQRMKETVLSIANRHEMEAARATSLLPGVLEALEALRKMGLKMALYTVNDEAPTDYVLKRFRLRRFFNAVVTRRSVPEVKPNPAHLDTALRVLRVKPEEAVVVGDSVYDVRCARGLGVTVVSVTTGISSPRELAQAGATRLISSLTELPALVKQFGGPQST